MLAAGNTAQAQHGYGSYGHGWHPGHYLHLGHGHFSPRPSDYGYGASYGGYTQPYYGGYDSAPAYAYPGRGYYATPGYAPPVISGGHWHDHGAHLHYYGH